MIEEAHKKAGNYTSEQLQAVLDQLSADQIRYVVARQHFSTDREAAEEIGISAQTVYRWPDVVKEAVRMMALDGVVMASHVLHKALAKAALVKVAGLDSANERVRQGVATEVLDRGLGKAAESVEVTVKDADETRQGILSSIRRIADAGETEGVGGEPDA